MIPDPITLLVVLAVAILFVQILILFRRRKGAAGPGGSKAGTMNDMFGVICSHYLLIYFSIVLGTLIGTGLYFVTLHYHVRYTALAYIEVVPPGDDPFQAVAPSVNPDLAYQFRNTIAAQFRPETFTDDLLRKENIRKTPWFRRLAERRGFPLNEDIRTRAGNYLKRYLRVAVDRDSNWILVSFDCFGPSGKQDSAFILNEIVQILSSKQRSLAEMKFIQQKTGLDNQRKDIQSILDSASTAMKSVLSGSDFPDLLTDTKDSYLSSLLVQLELRRLDLDSRIASIDRKIRLLERPASKTTEDSPVHGSNMQLETVGVQSTQITASTDNAKSSTSPDMTLPASSDSAELGDLRQERSLLASQLESLQKQIDGARNRLAARTRARQEIEPIQARRDAAQRSVQNIDSALEKINIWITSPSLSGLTPGRAVEPEESSGPLWYVHIPIGFMYGLITGMGITWILAIKNARLRFQVNQIRQLGVPLLGEICHEEIDDEVEDVDLSQVVRQAPFSLMSEDYRKLRLNLRQVPSAADRKILLFTSPAKGDGKTTVASNLAAILLAEGRKVLFIDANFRNPASMKIYPHPAAGAAKGYPDFGLSNYLLGQCSDPRDIIRPCGIADLDVIDCGPIPANSAGMFGGPAMRKLLDTLRDSYEFILIDGPAMLVSDAVALAAMAEGTIVVFNTARLNKEQPERILQELKTAQAAVLGTVLVGVRNIEGGYSQEYKLAYQKYQKAETTFVNPAG
jgi:capsular exopolysaccharide synthesis family protein